MRVETLKSRKIARSAATRGWAAMPAVRVASDACSLSALPIYLQDRQADLATSQLLLEGRYCLNPRRPQLRLVR